MGAFEKCPNRIQKGLFLKIGLFEPLIAILKNQKTILFAFLWSRMCTTPVFKWPPGKYIHFRIEIGLSGVGTIEHSFNAKFCKPSWFSSITGCHNLAAYTLKPWLVLST